MKYFILFAFFIAIVIVVKAVDRSKFRTCADTGFCRRYRGKIGPSQGEQYTVDLTSIRQASPSRFVGLVNGPNLIKPLNLEISVLVSGAIRVRFVEEIPRWQPSDILNTNALQGSSATLLGPSDPKLPKSIKSIPKDSFIAIGIPSIESIFILHLSPFKIELYRGETRLIVANERSLLHYEVKGASNVISMDDTSSTLDDVDMNEDRHGGKEVIDYGEDGLAIYADGTKEERKLKENNSKSIPTATESFGGHTDSMPNGPMSVGMDVSFPFAQHIYGLPEHTSPLSLPTTTIGSANIAPKYSQPYRLYNLDVFEYELDETMALYGHIPFLMAHGLSGGKAISAGVFWFNPSEAFVDISDGGDTMNSYKQSHWMLESGMIDLFLFAGPNPMTIFQQLTEITGRQALPPIFALGYHQCRWNYRDEKDVASVEAGFEELDYPMDVIWLDIEHTDGKRYFTWDKSVFPNPIEMQQNISSHGRRMVTIVDPHIKTDRNYHIHKEATDKGLYIKEMDGTTDFKGWCWPGESSYLDFTDSKVRQWWAEQFSLDRYQGSTLDLFTWNDMNEPSVFNGPEVSMKKDTKNLAGVEHREWHNLYGVYMQRATSEGLTLRAPQTQPKPRPFVLSRAFWAGSQKYGAIWTGDNKAEWGHLKVASPMLLSINMAGLSFAGADVGGFFGDPDAELFTRWYQAGAFTPFFRGHAHHDSKRREPWVYGEPTTSILRSYAMLRYSLLPYWYTMFYAAYQLGFPVMRPLFVEFPEETITFALDDQWMVGDALLVKPITDPGVTTTEVYLPGQQPWYDLKTLQKYTPTTSLGNKITIPAPIESMPVFIRGGKIIPRKLRLRRSSKLMYYDPYTLIVALDMNDEAEGWLYTDDETTYDHREKNAYALQKFTYSKGVLENIPASWTGNEPLGTYEAVNTVERVVIVGLNRPPYKVMLKSKDGNRELSSYYDKDTKILTIKKPDVKVTDSWAIAL